MKAPPGGDERRAGPLDDALWPDHLTARVVSPGPNPAIHGYDVEGDLARHYTFTETVLLALTGELPTPERARAFEIALQFLSPCTVQEAPAHAAVLARVCNVLDSAVLGTAAVALAEQARTQLAPLAAWLADAEAAAPAPPDEEERRSVARLRETLAESGVSVPGLDVTTGTDVGRLAALALTLRFAGLGHLAQMQSALVLARLPLVISEAFATPAHAFRDYPVDLPPIRYREEP